MCSEDLANVYVPKLGKSNLGRGRKGDYHLADNRRRSTEATGSLFLTIMAEPEHVRATYNDIHDLIKVSAEKIAEFKPNILIAIGALGILLEE